MDFTNAVALRRLRYRIEYHRGLGQGGGEESVAWIISVRSKDARELTEPQDEVVCFVLGVVGLEGL